MTLNKIEEEVVLLKAINEIIDSIVNFEVLALTGSDPNTFIFFHSMTHQRFFNIVLVDFLSRTDKRSPVNQTSYLGALKAISENPNFNVGGSISLLSEATRMFIEWLEQEVEIQVMML